MKTNTPTTQPKEPGVTYNKQRSRWIVRKTIKGKRRQIASLKTLSEANSMVASLGENDGFDTNILFTSKNEKGGHPSRSQCDLRDGGDHNLKVCIGRNEAKTPTKRWNSFAELDAWLDEQPATFWKANNGDVATLISQQNRFVLVEYKSKKGTIHYEVSFLSGSEYDFNIHNPSTDCFYTKREATKAYNKRTAA
jgi:hypothetical protein